MLPEIDLDGQRRLLAAKVLLIGAGGLGSPAALYLASAGVGTLTICDGDAVDLTNLQRQIVHREASIGVNKAESAARTLRTINAECRVVPVACRVTGEDLDALVRQADVVVDASDNFETRYAVNEKCVLHRRPLVSGAAVGYAGQLAVFDRRQSGAPCYHCLFPQSGVQAESERCATLGVFAPLTGMIGAAQAAEAIRLIAHGRSALAGQLALFDALSMDWERLDVSPDPKCRVCAPASGGECPGRQSV